MRNTKNILRVIVLLAAYGFVGYKIFASRDTAFFSLFLRELQFVHYTFLVLVIVLAIFNWTLETYKWKIAMAPIYPIGFVSALQTVLYGAGVGLFTPNRIGDPVGRVAMLQPEHRGRGAAMAIVTSMSQQLATIVFGILGLILWSSQRFPKVIPIWAGIILTIISFILVVVIILGHKRILLWAAHFKPIAKLLKDEPLDSDLPWSSLTRIVLLSLFRYLIFSTQLVLLLHYFGFEGDLVLLYSAIFISYLFSSVVPSIAIAEVGVKAGFAILFVGSLWPNTLGIALASLLIWIVNVAIPALVGVWLPWISFEKPKTS